MEILVAVALTSSSAATWTAARLWSHQIVLPTLYYLGSILTIFAMFRWGEVFFDYTDDSTTSLTFITAVQIGIILVMWSGKRFHDNARIVSARFEASIEKTKNGID